MKKLTRPVISMALVASALLSGCSSSDDSSTQAVPSQSSIVTVERGPILGATVSDANGVTAKELTNGRYEFSNKPVYPITANGGVIDVDRSGDITPGDVENTIELTSKDNTSDVLTIATTLASNEELKDLLEDAFEILLEDINSKTPSDDDEIEALSDEIYKYASENNITDVSKITKAELEMLLNQFQERLSEYQEDTIALADTLRQEALDALEITKDEALAIAAQAKLDALSLSGEAKAEALKEAEELIKEILKETEEKRKDILEDVKDSETEAAHRQKENEMAAEHEKDLIENELNKLTITDLEALTLQEDYLLHLEEDDKEELHEDLEVEHEDDNATADHEVEIEDDNTTHEVEDDDSITVEIEDDNTTATVDTEPAEDSNTTETKTDTKDTTSGDTNTSL